MQNEEEPNEKGHVIVPMSLFVKKILSHCKYDVNDVSYVS